MEESGGNWEVFTWRGKDGEDHRKRTPVLIEYYCIVSVFFSIIPISPHITLQPQCNPCITLYVQGRKAFHTPYVFVNESCEFGAMLEVAMKIS